MPPWLYILLGVALLLAVVRRILPRIGLDLAPGWVIECAKCGRRRPLAEVGGIRMGSAKSKTSWTAARCRGCGRIRRARVIHESRLNGGRR